MTMAESTVAVESDLILPYRFEPEVAVRGRMTIVTIVMTARLVSLSGLATPHGAVARTALLCHVRLSVIAVERCQR